MITRLEVFGVAFVCFIVLVTFGTVTARDVVGTNIVAFGIWSAIVVWGEWVRRLAYSIN